MVALFRALPLFAAVLAIAGILAPVSRADGDAPKSNLKGKIEETEWSNQEMKTKEGMTIPKGIIVLTFKKDYSFTFDIKGASTGKGKLELKEKDAIVLHFTEEFNGRKDHEEQITIDKDLLTLVDTDGTTLKFDRVKPTGGGLLGAVGMPPAGESNLKGKIEGTKWTSQEMDLKDGRKLPANSLKLDFNKDMTFTYKAGPMTWTGKYELLKGDGIKLISDQDLGGKKENIESMFIKGKSLKMVDPDGTEVMFDAVAAEAPKDPAASLLKGKIEGTEWKSRKASIKGAELPAGTLTLKFGKDMSLVYTAGPVQKWTGKYELLAGDQVRLLTEQELGGRKDNIEKIVIEKDLLTMTDTDGTELGFDRVTGKEEPKGKQMSRLKGKIEGTKWKSLKSTVNGNEIPAGAISIDFNANMTFTYRAGPMTWTGKYVLLDGDDIKLLSEQDLGGSKENLEKIVIDKNALTMTDPNGTALKFEKAPSDD